MLKPEDPQKVAAAKAAAEARTLEELEDHLRFADDKERLVGLLGAPLGGAIAILIAGALVSHDPSALLKSGLPNKLHVSVSLYRELEIVLLVLSFLMLATAWFRKRLYLGMVMALYGLAVFNLHYWGFGVPYVMFGAWFLVRAYRAQRAVKEATAAGPTWNADTARPRPTRRYSSPAPKWATPKTPPPQGNGSRRGHKPDDEPRADWRGRMPGQG